MNDVIVIKGTVAFQINLDPSIWIFDERHFPMHDHFPEVEGLGMFLAPFLAHARPVPEATALRIHRRKGNAITLPLEKATSSILQFAREGKPIRPDGPALLYCVGESSQQVQPIGFIESLEVIADEGVCFV